MNERAIFFEECIETCISNIDLVSEKNKAEKTKKSFYENLREVINVFCNFSFEISYVCFGILQFFAIWTGLLNVFHNNNIITLLVSLGLGFAPFIGTVFGIWGAHAGWGWDLSRSIFTFVIPYVIVNGPISMIILYETYKDIKRWRAEEKYKIN